MQTRLPGEPLPQPNCCFICENFITPDAKLLVIDTLRDFDPGIITRLNGRKLVCESCAAEMAVQLGYVSSAFVAELEAEIAEAVDIVLALENRLEEQSEAHTAAVAAGAQAIADFFKAQKATITVASVDEMLAQGAPLEPPPSRSRVKKEVTDAQA